MGALSEGEKGRSSQIRDSRVSKKDGRFNLAAGGLEAPRLLNKLVVAHGILVVRSAKLLSLIIAFLIPPLGWPQVKMALARF